MSFVIVFRAVLLYLFLILITRVVGRRPGKQITPFEFVLIFYLGGLCLTGMVGREVSLTNAFTQIMCIAFTHLAVTCARVASPKIARLLDGTPLVLLEAGTWRTETMRRMRIGDADVMQMARDQGLKTFQDIDTATLERNGEISIIAAEKDDDSATGGSKPTDAPEKGDRQDEDTGADDPNEPRPVGDTVAKVDNAVAVGEDLHFQRRWWKFESVVWSFFALILLADLVGLLGNGPLAHAHRATSDGTLLVRYDKIERASSPVTLTVQPGRQAIQNGRVALFVSDSVVKELGAQRIAPQPAVSAIGNGGVTYLFPALSAPARIQFELQPSSIGLHHFTIGIAGGEQIKARILVLP